MASRGGGWIASLRSQRRDVFVSGRYGRSRVKLSFHHLGKNFNSLPRGVIQDSKHCWTSSDGITPSIYSCVCLDRTFTRSSLNPQFRAACVASMTLSKGPSAIGIWGAVASARTATARKSAADRPFIIEHPITIFRSLSGIASDCNWSVSSHRRRLCAGRGLSPSLRRSDEGMGRFPLFPCRISAAKMDPIEFVDRSFSPSIGL